MEGSERGATADTLAVFEQRAAGTPLTASEVAAALDISRRSAYDRLKRLADRGDVETKKVGARGRVWWQPPTTTRATVPGGSGRDLVDQLLQTAPIGGVAVFDDALRFSLVEGALWGDVEPSGGDHEWRALAAVLPDETADEVHRLFRAALSGERGSVDATVGDHSYRVWATPVWTDDDEVTGGRSVAIDVTARAERERELERCETIVETVDDGIYAVDAAGRFAHVNDAFCELVGRSREALLGRPAERVHAEESFKWRAAELAKAISRGERETGRVETEFRTADGDAVPVEVALRPVVLADGFGRCGVVRDVSERLAREGQLDAVNSLNRVVRETTDAVVEQSTREEIERTVCEHLAAADSYRFAWFGDVDTQSQTIELRAEAGVDGYLDGITVPVGPDDPRSESPCPTALRTGELQVVQDVTVEETLDPWRDHVEQYGFRSAAAIPVVHGDTTFGVLCLYADRPHAFSGEEREVIGQLGELVGHAIAAVERKRALTSDDLVELEFRIPDALDSIGVPPDAHEPVSFDRSVPLGGDEYLLFGTTTGAGVETIETIADALPHWTDLEVLDDRFGEVSFEVTLTEPPILSVVAAHGGTAETATFEDGNFLMTVHLPGGGDVQRVMEAVTDLYPEAEALARRQIRRPSDPAERVTRTWVDDLTERQRNALEAAYFGGYFEWPRDSSGQEVAERLGISSATLSQHLRNAEAKLLDALFEEIRVGN